MCEERCFANELEYMKCLYKEQRTSSLLATTRALLWQAKHTFQKAKINNHMREALAISKQVDFLNGLEANKSIICEPFQTTELFRSLQYFYDPSVDDILIISGLELYAKALLLKKRFIIHNITEPEDIKKQQKKQPISFDIYKDNIKIGVQTIAVSEILKSKYKKHIDLSEDTLKELINLNTARNKLHFCMVRFGSIYTKKISALNELGCQINKYFDEDGCFCPTPRKCTLRIFN